MILCAEIKAAIFVWQNKELGAMLNPINMRNFCTEVMQAILV